MMKIEKIRELSNEELVARSRELRKEMLNLRIQKSLGQLENRSAIKYLRRENAQVMSILGERRLGINAGLGASAPAAAKRAAPDTEADQGKPASKKGAVTKVPATKTKAAAAVQKAPAKKAATKTKS